jgi:hypothetical protein
MFGRRIVLVLAGFLFPVALHAQALPAASRGLSFEVGGGVSLASPDYSDQYIKGVSLFATADFSKGLGIDIEVHDTDIITPHDLGEKSYLAGIRYGRHFKKFYPYGKGLLGIGTFSFHQGYFPAESSKNYSQFALGGGLEYRATEHITIRAIDAEFQTWTTFSPNNLSPIVYTVGAAYRFR